LADFTYTDREGILTGKLYGDATKANWNDNWPNYHLEVKTTSGAEREHFYMSRSQLWHVGKFHLIRSSHGFAGF
jgi:hypothetical protein